MFRPAPHDRPSSPRCSRRSGERAFLRAAGTARARRELGVRPRGGRERGRRHLFRPEPFQCPHARGQLHGGRPARADGVPPPARGARLRDVQHAYLSRRTRRRRGLPARDHRRRGRRRHRAGHRRVPADPAAFSGLSHSRVHPDDRHQRGGRGVRARSGLSARRPGAGVFHPRDRSDPRGTGGAQRSLAPGGVRPRRAVRGVFRVSASPARRWAGARPTGASARRRAGCPTT